MSKLDQILVSELTPKGRKLPKAGETWEVKRGKKNSGTDVTVVEVTEVVDVLWVYYRSMDYSNSHMSLPLGKFTSFYTKKS